MFSSSLSPPRACILKSSRPFGQSIEQAVREVLREQGVENARVRLTDRGALECVIRARVETAVRRGREER